MQKHDWHSDSFLFYKTPSLDVLLLSYAFLTLAKQTLGAPAIDARWKTIALSKPILQWKRIFSYCSKLTEYLFSLVFGNIQSFVLKYPLKFSVSLYPLFFYIWGATIGPRVLIFACLCLGPRGCFAVNAALVASQWQYCAWTVTSLLPFNAEHEAGQASSIVFQGFGMTWPGPLQGSSDFTPSPLCRYVPDEDCTVWKLR